ncbi:MAG TPA: RagB/SusD family nutrient uptake outer membrane protein [Chitinophagaceae bacterium]|nr:RagB/SusD family nutrient uptake outer membrane protein [Chitinophagaceae bacterium]
MKKIFSLATFSLLLSLAGCKKDSEFLNVQPFAILTTTQSFSDPAQVVSIVADLYNRQVDLTAFKNSWESFIDPGEAVPSTFGHVTVQRNGWGFGEWGNWDYGYIREINLFIERATAATALSEADKKRFLAEGRFLRAAHYFEMVKRMGGVPIIKESLLYDFSGDPSYLQNARAKESEVYDFVISELEAIKNDLPVDARTKDRATKATALAMKSRAALYAASTAKYGATTPQVFLSGNEVGIPASMATAYYQTALAAAKEIISGSAGAYSLYNKFPANPAQNFTALFVDNADKPGNPETIWIEDYKIKAGKTHGFTIQNQPIFGAEEVEGGRVNPSLNLVQTFELLNNTYAPLPINDASGNPIYYNDPLELFAGRDGRLAGTVVLPGSVGKNRPVDIFAGYQLANGTVVNGSSLGFIGKLPGSTDDVKLVGSDGPLNAREYAAQSGFYLRKFVDPAVGSGSRGTGSEVPWIRYRYAEVLLNAAEAAFELGLPEALGYMNQVRARAGFTTPLTAAQLNFNRIVNERRVELAFEGHLLFDKKRWRLAHIVWDGSQMNESELVTNIGDARKRSTQPFGLWPYKIYNPGGANHNKWIFKIVKNSIVTGASRFQLGNYYSEINSTILANNPKILRQPNQ